MKNVAFCEKYDIFLRVLENAVRMVSSQICKIDT
jgi:hypothetical protein